MKKKSKIFVSVFTFCVAILALCFGVYAAINISFNLGGTVNYNVNDAKVEVTTQLLWSEYKAKSSYDLKTQMVDKIISGQDTKYDLHERDINGHDVEGNADVYNSTATGANDARHRVNYLQIDYKADITQSYYIVITVKNIGETEVYYRVKSQTFEEDLNSHVYVSAGDSRIQKPGGISKDEYYTSTMVIAFSLDDISKNVENVNFEYEIEIGAGKMPTDLIMIDPDGSASEDKDVKTYNGDEYYAVEMGYIDGDPKTPIYWRLISIDNGVSPYIFNPSKIPVGMGVFILETVATKSVQFEDAHEYMNTTMLVDLHIGSSDNILNQIDKQIVTNEIKSDDGVTMLYQNADTANEEGWFYLLTERQALNMICRLRLTYLDDYTELNEAGFNKLAWGARYLLRTTDGTNAYSVSTSGKIETTTSGTAVRPVFNIYL